MTRVEHELRKQFEEAVCRVQRDGSVEQAFARGTSLRRRRRTAYAALSIAALVLVSAGVIATPWMRTSTRSIAPIAPSQGAADLPTTYLSDEDRAVLTAVDAVLGAMTLPRTDGKYPHLGGAALGYTGNWGVFFHLKACSTPEECRGRGPQLIRVDVEVEGDVGRVVGVEAPQLTPEELEGVGSYEAVYQEGGRGFEITASWLWDLDGQGVAIGSYVWRGTVPTWGFEYRCSATVFDANDNVLYQGADHEVILPAATLQDHRMGLVGVPVDVPSGAVTTAVDCSDEETAPIPMHTEGLDSPRS